jgi:hypothetical protein
MFGRSARQADGSTGPRRGREGRGLGPFTSGHLTIIVVVVVIVVAFPLAAFAVTGSNVFVTDATSGAHAKVDGGGHVVVGDGVGALTVDGTVSGRPLSPSTPFQFNRDTSLGDNIELGPSPLSTAINLTSLTISVPSGETADIQLLVFFQSGSATSCSLSGFSVPIWHATNLTGNFAVSFPTALQSPKSTNPYKVCLDVLNIDDSVPIVNGSGFFGN